MDIGSYWGVIFLVLPLAMAVAVALRGHRPNDRHKCLGHSNARPAVAYDATAYIETGGMNQYLTDSGPGFPDRLSV